MARVLINSFLYARRPDMDRFEKTLSHFEEDLVKDYVKRKMDGENSLAIEKRNKVERTRVNSFAAQLTFGKMFNLYIDFERTYKSYDHVLTLLYPTGIKNLRVNIKWTQWEQGKLAVPVDEIKDPKRDICELYALMIGEFPTYVYRGCFPGPDLMMPGRIKDVGGRDCYAAEQKDLGMDFVYYEEDERLFE